MTRLLLILALTALACGSATTVPLPATVEPARPTPAVASPTPPPPTPTFTPLPPTSTSTPLAATAFPDPARYEWRLIVGGLERPVEIQNAGDGTGRLFVIEKVGRIRVIQNEQLAFAPFLDIADRVNAGANERGLLGLAFDPDFESNGFFYVNYTDAGGDTVIARFTASGDTADPNSEVKLLGVSQPFSNHNGGALAFGPDGYLYIGLGDGGAAGDPLGNGQKLSTFLGKILRIDVNSGAPYAIPSDNPFGDEIWAYGLRNPWRFSFDRLTGDLWIGDVGQNAYEEIDFVPAGTPGAPGGVNFGWNRYEGFHDYGGGAPLDNHWPPVLEYGHQDQIGGCSVTGGYVYRGSMSEWHGIYFFGDYCTGNVWAVLRLVNGSEELFNAERLFRVSANITSFGVDEAGELYLADDSGEIYLLAEVK
ncbi:MAG: PQQ-dependent sugar dehydrogenase [Chloroflexota bacterium]